MIYFLYTGKCPNLANFAPEILAAADRFQLPSLKDMADQVKDKEERLLVRVKLSIEESYCSSECSIG